MSPSASARSTTCGIRCSASTASVRSATARSSSESFICEDYSAVRGGLGHGYPGKQLVAEFYPTDELAGNRTNWWGPNLNCLAAWIFAAGFTDNLAAWKLTPNPDNIGVCRGFATGSKPPRK